MRDQYKDYVQIVLRHIHAMQQTHLQPAEEVALRREDVNREIDVWGIPEDAFGDSYKGDIDTSQLRMPFGFLNHIESARRLGYTLKAWSDGRQPKADPLEGESPEQWVTRIKGFVGQDMWRQFYSPITPAEENRARERMKEPDFPYNVSPEDPLYKERTQIDT